MKIKEKTRNKYQWYLSLVRENESRPLTKINYSENGVSAIESFHSIETYGKELPTREPLLLEKYLIGKIWHGVTVNSVAESFVDRIEFSKDIKQNYPEWVSEEIFRLSEKIARQRIGFVPTFIRERKDFSEDEI